MVIGLGLILIAVLVGPIFVKPIEHNIELFFLSVGALTSIITGQFGWSLVHAAVTEPIALTIAVLIFGALARLLRPAFDSGVQRLRAAVSARWIYFTLIVVLGLLSSVITAVIAALLLVEAIAMLKLDRPSETAAVVLACFAIGLGAALTPVGEPLGTIAIASLSVDFWYLMRLLGPLVVSGILIVAVISLFIPPHRGASLYAARPDDGWREIVLRAIRVYAFVAGLVGTFLGDAAAGRCLHQPNAACRAVLVEFDLGGGGQRDADRGRDRARAQSHSAARGADGTADQRRHADPRQHPQYRGGAASGNQQPGMGPRRSDYGAAPDGAVLRGTALVGLVVTGSSIIRQPLGRRSLPAGGNKAQGAWCQVAAEQLAI